MPFEFLVIVRCKRYSFGLFVAVWMPILINRKDVVNLLGTLVPVLRVVAAFLSMVLRKTDKNTAKNDHE